MTGGGGGIRQHSALPQGNGFGCNARVSACIYVNNREADILFDLYPPIYCLLYALCFHNFKKESQGLSQDD